MLQKTLCVLLTFIGVASLHVALNAWRQYYLSQAQRVGQSLSPVKVDIGEKVSMINKRYASYNVDSSYNRGFFHISFKNPNLRAAAKSLAPSTLRFGGGGNDYLRYETHDSNFSCKTVPGFDNADHGCLNASHRSDLLELAHEADTAFLFGLSFDMKQACSKKNSYVWSSDEATALIKSISQDKQTVWGFEVGNEVNNRAKGGNVDCGLVPQLQGFAIAKLYGVLKSLYPNPETRPKLVGPDTGYFEPQSWLNVTLSMIGHKLHAVTHHVYPGVARNNFNDPRVLDRVLSDIGWYVPIIKTFAPQAQIWAGEDGPMGGGESGTCSGTVGDPHNVSICGLYGSVLWYADDMCLRARHGFSQYQRQDLVGGRYSLIGIPHDNQFLSLKDSVTLHPDFWVNFLFKRTVGPNVLNVKLDAPRTLRVYAHCGLPPSRYSVAISNEASATLILINLDDASDAIVNVNKASKSTSFVLSPGKQGPFGNSPTLNGVPLPTTISSGKDIKHVPVEGATRDGNEITVPPLSISFSFVYGVESWCDKIKKNVMNSAQVM